MNNIDSDRLLSDRKYRTLLYEYHSLVAYIAADLNRYNTIQSAGVQFHKTSDLYELKEELIKMLKDTFPLFEVSLSKNMAKDMIWIRMSLIFVFLGKIIEIINKN